MSIPEHLADSRILQNSGTQLCRIILQNSPEFWRIIYQNSGEFFEKCHATHSQHNFRKQNSGEFWTNNSGEFWTNNSEEFCNSFYINCQKHPILFGISYLATTVDNR
ncbi:hypothetical protein ACKWTF_008079 [Chironomus riparius]